MAHDFSMSMNYAKMADEVTEAVFKKEYKMRKEDEKELEVAKKLAATEGFDYVERMGEWKGLAVYYVCEKELLGATYGYPTYVLVGTNDKARFAQFPIEVGSIMRTLPE